MASCSRQIALGSALLVVFGLLEFEMFSVEMFSVETIHHHNIGNVANANSSIACNDTVGTDGIHYESEYSTYKDTPLDENHVPEGFVLWNEEALKICEMSKGGPEGRRITCETDPTCRKCVNPSDLAQVDSVYAAFENETMKSERRSLFRNWFPEQKTILLIGTDSRFFHFAVNFECAAKARQMNITDMLLIIATDVDAYNMASKRGMKVLHPSSYSITTPGFLGTMVAVTAAAAELTSFGYNVCIMDADIVWLKNPLWMFEHPKLWLLDLQFQLAPRWDAQGVANTGFILAKATAKTQMFLKTLLKVSYLYFYAGDDQVVWNTLLRHWTMSQLHWQTLPRKLKKKEGVSGRFMDLHTKNGRDGSAKWIDEDTVILHAVHHLKAHKFNATGNWFVEGKGQQCAKCDVGLRARCSAL